MVSVPSPVDITDASDAHTGERQRTHLAVYGSAAIALIVGLWIGAGLGGIVLGVAVMGLWAVLPTAYAFAVGQLVYVVLLADGSETAIVGAATLGVLFVVELAERWPPRVARLGAVVFLTAAGVSIATWTVTEPIDSLALIAVGFVGLSYLGYRYGLVRLGFVDV